MCPANDALNEPSVELLAKFRAGSDEAADAIFNRYVERLVRLVQSRLSVQLARRFDAEDVVLSAYRSFFAGARRGQFSLERNGDLWRLLATMTLRKLYRQSARHSADRRSYLRDRSFDDWSGFFSQAVTKEPSPAEAVATIDELETLMSRLTPLGRQILELRLQGFLMDEIAGKTNRSERTIRRVLGGLRKDWATKLKVREQDS